MTRRSSRCKRHRRGPSTAAAVLAGLCAVVLGGAGVLAAEAAQPPAAAADPIADCSTTVGVVVAVDFSPWGGPIRRGCDATTTSAYDALHTAGFTTAGDAQDGPAFVCRIDGDPTPAQDACATTPPASASWSFWYADAGQGSWSYSREGAMTFRPVPGSVEAWTFGAAGAPPSFSPGAVRATNTEPAAPTGTTTTTPAGGGVSATTTPPSPAGTGSSGAPSAAGGSAGGPGPADAGTAGTGRGGGGATSPGSPSPTSVPSAARRGSATTPTSGRRTPATTGAPATRAGSASRGRGPSHPRIVDNQALTAHRTPAGSPLPALVGLGLVAVVAAAAGAVVWRRRRAG